MSDYPASAAVRIQRIIIRFRKLQEELIRLSRFQDVPLKFFILFNDNPIVLSDSMAATRTGEFYGKLIRYENMEEKDFYGLVSRTEGYGKSIPEWNIRYLDGKSYDCFSYILKMPLDGMETEREIWFW